MIWQRLRRRQLETLIRSAKTDFPITEEYQARVTAALEHAPAPTPTRSRKRVIALAAIGAVVLFGLGFIPIPLGKAPGALERAIAAANQFTAVFWHEEMPAYNNPRAETLEGQGIHTVHYVAWVLEDIDEGKWQTREHSIEYPDKELRIHKHPAAVACFGELYETSITRNGDRSLAWGGTGYGEGAGGDGKVYEYRLGRPTLPIISPDAFTESGVEETGMVGKIRGALGRGIDGGEDLFNKYVELDASGARVIVTEHRKSKAPSYRGIYRTYIDPVTHLVSGWDYRVTGIPGAGCGPSGEALDLIWNYHEIVRQVEYNIEFPEDFFNTEPPEGAMVLDVYSPEGIKRHYNLSVLKLEQAKQRSNPETWKKAADYWSHEEPSRFSELPRLSPKDQAEIRAKLAAIGIQLAQ